MFSYCNNNPCNGSDPDGHMIQGRSEYGPNAMTYKGGGKVYCTPHWLIEEEKPGTLTIGISFTSISRGVVLSHSIGFTIDRDWNVAWTGTHFWGGGLEDTGISVFATITNTTNITGQNGTASHIGGSVGKYCGEYCNFLDNEGNMYHGITVSYTLASLDCKVPLNYHVGVSNTKVGSFEEVMSYVFSWEGLLWIGG